MSHSLDANLHNRINVVCTPGGVENGPSLSKLVIPFLRDQGVQVINISSHSELSAFKLFEDYIPELWVHSG